MADSLRSLRFLSHSLHADAKLRLKRFIRDLQSHFHPITKERPDPAFIPHLTILKVHSARMHTYPRTRTPRTHHTLTHTHSLTLIALTHVRAHAHLLAQCAPRHTLSERRVGNSRT